MAFPQNISYLHLYLVNGWYDVNMMDYDILYVVKISSEVEYAAQKEGSSPNPILQSLEV